MKNLSNRMERLVEIGKDLASKSLSKGNPLFSFVLIENDGKIDSFIVVPSESDDATEMAKGIVESRQPDRYAIIKDGFVHLEDGGKVDSLLFEIAEKGRKNASIVALIYKKKSADQEFEIVQQIHFKEVPSLLKGKMKKKTQEREADEDAAMAQNPEPMEMKAKDDTSMEFETIDEEGDIINARQKFTKGSTIFSLNRSFSAENLGKDIFLDAPIIQLAKARDSKEYDALFFFITCDIKELEREKRARISKRIKEAGARIIIQKESSKENDERARELLERLRKGYAAASDSKKV